MKIAAIHQPNFFPWLGFFNKLYRSDAFVLLDNVQFPKKGGFWSNRVQVLINGRPSWITVPVVRNYHGFRNINEMEIDNSKSWREKILRTVEINYSRAGYFNEVFPLILALINNQTADLFQYNLNILNTLFDLLAVNKNIYTASELNTEGNSTDLLITILKSINADAYICGAGSANYQEDEKFEQNGIELIHQNYIHPVYAQLNTKEFVKGLSVIDALMNTGIEGTRKLIAEG